ncbi:hypothetical protein [Vibrio sp. 10N.261.51.F12]|uniref:hypothetical protein n=1 Tax=Vibrio sp. 10N.261.51.F12 TaxID=3229679 RepID=UPI00354CAA96
MELDSDGYEFYGFSDPELRGMLIERIEFALAAAKWSRVDLAKKSGLPKSSVYAKLNRELTSELTFSDLCAIAKGSTLKKLDDLLSRPEEEFELVYQLDLVIRNYMARQTNSDDE